MLDDYFWSTSLDIIYTPANMTMTSTNRLSRVLHTVAHPHNKPIPWLDPESSIGAFCRELGNDKCWELKGPGLEQYRILAKDVKEHLEKYCQRQTATVLWSAYMVGHSREVACPTVFFCGQEEPRKRIRRIVRKSGILEKYPGFKTGDSCRPPDMDQLIKLAGDDDAKLVGSTCTCRCPTGISIKARLIGSEDVSHLTQNVATIGAILNFGEILCFTTAAHAFGMGDVGFESHDDSEFEFDLSDDDYNTETDSEDLSECAVLPVQQISESQFSTETSRLGSDNGSQPASNPGPEAVFSTEDIVFSSQDTGKPFLDYALVPIKQEDHRLFKADFSQESTCDFHGALPRDVARSNQGGPVVAYTGSRQVVHGTLLESPSFVTSMETGKTQELWNVKFKREAIARGDCGSLVADLAAKNYIGHIIAGSPVSGSVLVVPASDVFDDIRDRSGQKLSLATEMEWIGTHDSTEKVERLVQDEVPTEILMTASGDRAVLQAATKPNNTNVGDKPFIMGEDVNARSRGQIVPSIDSVEVTHERRSQYHEALGVSHTAIVDATHKQDKPKGADDTCGRAGERSIEGLGGAIEAARHAVQSTLDHQVQAAHLRDLSNVLRERFERTGTMKDLEEAIETARLAVDVTSPGHESTTQMKMLEGLNGRNPLSWAAENGHDGTVKQLLDAGKVEANSKEEHGRTPLSLAAENGREAIVKQLLDSSKIDVDSKDNDGRTPLSWAVENGHEGTVKLLLDTNEVDVDSKDSYGRTPLSLAAQYGRKAIVKLLLDTGKVDVDSKDKYSRTPLSLAAENGHEAMVKQLLDTGKVDVDSKYSVGRTLLLWAAAKGHEAIVKQLLETGKVDVDSKDNDGRTPLSWAAENGHEGTVKLLLDTNEVDVDSKDSYGRTPLSLAVQYGRERTVKQLLDTGKVDVDSKDEDGQTLLAWAAENGREAMVKQLLDNALSSYE